MKQYSRSAISRPDREAAGLNGPRPENDQRPAVTPLFLIAMLNAKRARQDPPQRKARGSLALAAAGLALAARCWGRSAASGTSPHETSRSFQEPDKERPIRSGDSKKTIQEGSGGLVFFGAGHVASAEPPELSKGGALEIRAETAKRPLYPPLNSAVLESYHNCG